MSRTDSPAMPQEVYDRLLAADGMRCSSRQTNRFPARGTRPHKEWMHFCIFARDASGSPMEILLNLSVNDGIQTAAHHGSGIARCAVIVQTEAISEGIVHRVAAEDVSFDDNRIGCRFGDVRMEFDRGGYRLTGAHDTSAGPLTFDVSIKPLAQPLLTPSASLGDGVVRWLVTPQCVASGSLRLGGEELTLQHAPAYHDHNWGSFNWGADFSWQWGIVLPEESCDSRWLLISRVLDKHRQVVRAESLILGEGSRFHEFDIHDYEVSRAGYFDAPPAVMVPDVMRLCVPGRQGDVPQRLRLRGSGGRQTGESVDVRLETVRYSQIGIPDDTDDYGISLLTEVSATARVEGCCRGEPFAFSGRALWETTHACLL